VKTTAELTRDFLAARDELVTRLVNEGRAADEIAKLVNVTVQAKPKSRGGGLVELLYNEALNQLFGEDSPTERRP
jgi:hypothetical protein